MRDDMADLLSDYSPPFRASAVPPVRVHRARRGDAIQRPAQRVHILAGPRLAADQKLEPGVRRKAESGIKELSL